MKQARVAGCKQQKPSHREFKAAPGWENAPQFQSHPLLLDPSVQARTMRQSVDVTRLSRIALSNLEREGDGSDYTAVEMQPGDVRIETADAELDFVDERDDGA
eukprot:scaffold29526_cov19-Tisochrysis_lutea.AAC.1